jgi:DNA invertase Pin-like site-specific DNA recombinase
VSDASKITASHRERLCLVYVRQSTLDLCGMTGTLIADVDGIYDPSAYSGRMVLGLKGTISEAELHLIKGPADRRDAAQGGQGRAAGRAAGRTGA